MQIHEIINEINNDPKRLGLTWDKSNGDLVDLLNKEQFDVFISDIKKLRKWLVLRNLYGKLKDLSNDTTSDNRSFAYVFMHMFETKDEIDIEEDFILSGLSKLITDGVLTPADRAELANVIKDSKSRAFVLWKHPVTLEDLRKARDANNQ